MSGKAGAVQPPPLDGHGGKSMGGRQRTARGQQEHRLHARPAPPGLLAAARHGFAKKKGATAWDRQGQLKGRTGKKGNWPRRAEAPHGTSGNVGHEARRRQRGRRDIH
eukprot:GHVT01071738.1.p1 GENE.GHVT01071738.1~~GHVT01071738.1.p1  ORF type:complete len:108 (+),score=18.18 GHVT01071738.1:350-673(+)